MNRRSEDIGMRKELNFNNEDDLLRRRGKAFVNNIQSMMIEESNRDSVKSPSPFCKKILFDESSTCDSPGIMSTKSTQESLNSDMLLTFENEENQCPNLPFDFRRKNLDRKHSLPPFSLSVLNCNSQSTADEENSQKDSFDGIFSQPTSLVRNCSPFKDFDLSISKSKSDLPSLPNLGGFSRQVSTPQSCMDIEFDSFSTQSQSPTKLSSDIPDIKRLPTIPNQFHSNIATISASTMEEMLTTNKNEINFLIIDCRYEYEYSGGHIQDAINITDPYILEHLFITNAALLLKPSYLASLKKDFKKVIQSLVTEKNYEHEPSLSCPPTIIFHCEYSQERGPRMFNHLRKIDRELNIHRYPHLSYPEIYLLGDGYRNFHIESPKCCSPWGAYVEMTDARFKDELEECVGRDRHYWNKKTGKIRNFTRSSRTFSQIFN